MSTPTLTPNLDPTPSTSSSSFVMPQRSPSTPPRILSIAGSDSSCGAGIQADLKTISALHCYALTCITALTAQNTRGVEAIEIVEPEFVEKQLKTILDDVGVDLVKIGMLGSAAIIETISTYFETTFPCASTRPRIILDPVCVSTSGHQLLPLDALSKLEQELIPKAFVLTPNLPEAELLLRWENNSIKTLEKMKEACVRLAEFGSEWIYLKGGHSPFNPSSSSSSSSSSSMEEGEGKYLIDLLYHSKGTNEFFTFKRKWLDSKNTHGTGCTLSSAIAAFLGKGLSVPEAVEKAGDYVALAIATSYPLGSGSGPVNHFHSLITRSIPLPTPLSPTPFTDHLISHSKSTWSNYIHHPFPLSLANGTCAESSFLEFITQDYHFLIHYARTISLMTYKSNDRQVMNDLNQIVQTVLKETEMHIKYCQSFSISTSTLLTLIPESISNLAYNRYVLDVVQSSNLLRAQVVTAPCLIGYGRVGQMLVRKEGIDGIGPDGLNKTTSRIGIEDENHVRNGIEKSNGIKDRKGKDANRYWSWIKEYGQGWYQEAVKTGIYQLEKSVQESPISNKELNELCEIFKKATELEIAFWDAAVAAKGDFEKWQKLKSKIGD